MRVKPCKLYIQIVVYVCTSLLSISFLWLYIQAHMYCKYMYVYTYILAYIEVGAMNIDAVAI